MGLLGTGPDFLAEIGLDARGFLLGTRQVETSLFALARHPFLTGAAVVGGIGGLGVKAAVDFESAMAGVAKTMGLTNEETKEVADQIIALSKVKPFTATEIAKVAEIAGQLGISKDHLVEFVSTMLDMGAATNMTADEAADAFARFAAAAGVPQDKFDEMGATVVDLGNNFAATEAEIIKMAFRIAGAGTTVGLSTQEILGLSAALSSMGIKAEMGGSAMSRILKNIHVAVNDTSKEGAKRLNVMASVAGVTAAEFARVWKTDPAVAVTQFLQGLSDMEEAGVNLIPVLEAMGMSEIRVSDVLLRAKNGQDLVKTALERASLAWEANTALTDEASRRYATTASQLRLLGNDVAAAAIAFGTAMLPAVQSVIAAMREFVQTGGGEGLAPIRDALGALKDTVITRLGEIGGAFLAAFSDAEGNPKALVAAFAEALGALTVAVDLLSLPLIPVAAALGAMAGFVTSIEGGVWLLVDAIGALTLVMWAHKAGLAAMTVAQLLDAAAKGVLTAATWGATAASTAFAIATAPVTLIILGIAAAIGAAILIWKHWDTIVAAFTASVEWLTRVVQNAWGAVASFGAYIAGGLISAWDSASTKAQEVASAVGVAWDTTSTWLSGVWSNIVAGASVAWDVIKEVFTRAFDFVVEAGGVWVERLLIIPRAIFDGWKATLAALVLVLDAVFSGDFGRILDIVQAWAGALAGIATDVFHQIVDPITAVVSTIVGLGANIFGEMKAGFEEAWAAVVAWMQALPSQIAGFLANLPGNLKSLGKRIVRGLADGFEDAWDDVVDFFEDLWDDMGDFGEDVLEDLEDVVDDVIDTVRDTVSKAWKSITGFIKDAPGVVRDAFAGAVNAFVGVGAQLIGGLMNGISSVWATFKSWLSGKWEEMVQWARDILDMHSPSRVFAEIGENVVAGFQQGIEPLGDLLNGKVNATVTMNGGQPGGARGGVTIGTLVIHANNRRDGDAAFEAFERRLRALGVNG